MPAPSPIFVVTRTERMQIWDPVSHRLSLSGHQSDYLAQTTNSEKGVKVPTYVVM